MNDYTERLKRMTDEELDAEMERVIEELREATARIALRQGELESESLNPGYTAVIDHIVGLGFSRIDAESIAGMDLDSESDRQEHYQHILGCTASDISSWIGISPSGGAA